jgi:hypothetical protein
VAEKKSFLLRVDERLLESLKRWADDEFRSLNGQIEFLLREAMIKAGRWKAPPASGQPESRDGD